MTFSPLHLSAISHCPVVAFDMYPCNSLISCDNFVKPLQTKQQSTCNLAYDRLRDPAVVEESFDLFLHQVAVSPVKKKKKKRNILALELLHGG